MLGCGLVSLKIAVYSSCIILIVSYDKALIISLTHPSKSCPLPLAISVHACNVSNIEV